MITETRNCILGMAFLTAIVNVHGANAQTYQAAPVLQQPFYVALGAGVAFRSPAKDPVGETTFDPGFIFSAAAGARFGAFRVEGEYNKIDNNNNQLRVAGLPQPLNGLRPATGNIEITTYFVNAAYDFELSGSRFAMLGKPFVSIGFGALQSSIHSLANDITAAGGAFIVNSTSQYIAAGQIKVGTAIPVTDRIDLFADYRYMRGLQPLTFLLQDGSVARPNAVFNILEVGARLNF